MLGRIRKISGLSITKFLRWNFFSRSVIRDKGVYLLPYRGAVIHIDRTARVYLHAPLQINVDKYGRSREETHFRCDENAKLTVNGNFRIASKSTVRIHKNAEVSIGKAYMNHEAVIAAAYKMEIGDDILISRGVCIFDSDYHKILDNDGNQTNMPRTLIIGDHVWIGLRSILLRGSRIGDGAVIAAGSMVGGRIKPGTMAAGTPARSYSEVKWEA